VDPSPVPASSDASIKPNREVKSPPESNSVLREGAGKLGNYSQASFVPSLFSGTSTVVALSVGMFGLLGLYRFKSKQAPAAEAQSAELSSSKVESRAPETVPAQAEDPVATQRPDPAPNAVDQPAPAANAHAGNSTSSALYGAYRVDQEVGKLVLGQPHRLDVLASRSPDDRRAIETSLLKTVTTSTVTDDVRKRARQALEEYGFVARQCATLLLGSEAFERLSAARTLGEIQSPIALPFLLEALYDVEASVRNQAVASIGELKSPSAIGALVDLARRNPDVPSALLSRSLSACSLEGLEFFNDEPALIVPSSEPAAEEAAPEQKPESTVEIEPLPETLQDHGLARALADLRDAKESIRAQAIQELGQFRAQVSVQALVSVVRSGVNPGFRSLAISSLGKINHHSVFPAVLLAMADDAREVRAAAARALNRLTFDRGDAYVHLVETASADTIRDVAHACIQAGIVSQAIDRLASNDRRQAYEASSLVSLLSRGDMTDPVFEAILNHPSAEVRVAAATLLAIKGERRVKERLRSMTTQDGISEEVRTALLAVFDTTGAQPKEVNTEIVDTNGTGKEIGQKFESPSSSFLETQSGTGES
jgi:HEAT repeat protein